MEPNPAWLFKKSTRLNMLTRTYVGYALRGKKQGGAYYTQQDPRRQFQAFNILYVVLCIVLCPLLILYPTRPRSVMVLRKVVASAVNCFTIFFSKFEQTTKSEGERTRRQNMLTWKETWQF